MNPVLRDDVFLKERQLGSTEVMTMEGAINKSITALGLCFLAALLTWHYALAYAAPIVLGGSILGLILVVVTSFKPTIAPATTPLYALIEGAVLGAVSYFFEAKYPGIAFQAILLTFGVLGVMLVIYRLRIIQVTQKLRVAIVAGTGAVALIYLTGFVLGFFGIQIPYIHESGPIGIGFSLVVIGLAAFSLLLDFDSIESGVKRGAPRYMEWFSALGLLVTLVWLYLEILRLLSKLRSR